MENNLKIQLQAPIYGNIVKNNNLINNNAKKNNIKKITKYFKKKEMF